MITPSRSLRVLASSSLLAGATFAQTVTVTGVDDVVVDGSQSSTVTVSVLDASSNDAFDPLPDQTVSVTTTDNDVAGFTDSDTPATIPEG